MASTSHETGNAFSAVRVVAFDYLDGMMYADDDYLGIRFTDYLTMIITEGRGVIINKAFYVHPE